MGVITQWILKLATLAEAEARVFRWHAFRLGLALIVLLSGSLLAIGGIACAAVALIFWLGYYVGLVGALFIAAAALLILGGVLLWAARRLTD